MPTTLELFVVLASALVLLGAALQTDAPQAKTELVAADDAIVAGKPFLVALHMTMEPGWHSYYLNPGESGQATGIQWHLPPGFKAGPIEWPTPKREVIDDVAGYVYEGQVWLVTKILPPPQLQEGSVVHLEAKVNWLLCQKACFPQKSDLHLSLPVRSGSHANPAFAPALVGLAKPDPTIPVRARLEGKRVVLTIPHRIEAGKNLQFFPADPTYFGADPASISSSSAGTSLTVPLSRYAPGPPKRVNGILVLPLGNQTKPVWIDAKVTQR